MESVQYHLPEHIAPYVNCIMVGGDDNPDASLNIPLFADGYPGIMFQESVNGFYRLPGNKKLSSLFLFGQTLQPISLDVKGPYSYMVVQLYPFASKQLLGIDPRALNDDCYDLLELQNIEVRSYWEALRTAEGSQDGIRILTSLVEELLRANACHLNDQIRKAIHLIIENKGQIGMSEVQATVHLTERTLERQFLSETGLTPKQFARIIQFQSSYDRLNSSNFEKMVEIGYDSGFADQSHFIRTFKKYTGLTPSAYLKMTG